MLGMISSATMISVKGRAATPTRGGGSLIALAIRSRGGCLAFVPKSPVHTGMVGDGATTFVSRPSRSTSHLASRWGVVGCRQYGYVEKFCVGADRRVRPHGNPSLLWMMQAYRKSDCPCREGCRIRLRWRISSLVSNALARWVPRACAEVAGTHWHDWQWWHHFRLPALTLNIPPRIALEGGRLSSIWVR